MSIKVFVADDSDVMRTAIRRVLIEDDRIEIVGEASGFAQTIQMIGDCQPSVLLLDLHLPEQGDFTPAFVKSQLACVPHTLAISLANDVEAQALAASYGAEALLDKFKLYVELVPAIVHNCSKCIDLEPTIVLRRPRRRRSHAACTNRLKTFI